jgi:hypothetical protein
MEQIGIYRFSCLPLGHSAPFGVKSVSASMRFRMSIRMARRPVNSTVLPNSEPLFNISVAATHGFDTTFRHLFLKRDKPFKYDEAKILQ